MESNNDKSTKLTRRNVLVGATTGASLALPAALLPTSSVFASTGTPGNAGAEGFLSGAQYTIKHGDTSAVVTEVGAGLREFVVNGREFLDTYTANEMSPNSNGQVLIPFPNRIDQGTYTFEGTTEELPINEQGNDNAIHGLTRWLNWKVTDAHADSIQLSLVLHGQPGYPFVLAVDETYRVTPGVLWVTTHATNIGTSALPYAVGHHPYVTVGTDLINTNTLHVPAKSYFLTNSRLIPQPPAVSVSGTQYDFRTPHTIGTTFMDTGFTDLIFDADGYVRVSLTAPNGKPSVTVFADGHHKYLQLYTGDTLSDTTARRRSLAIEPYSAAADAFNNGLGLVVLQPGASFTSTWGIAASL